MRMSESKSKMQFFVMNVIVAASLNTTQPVYIGFRKTR